MLAKYKKFLPYAFLLGMLLLFCREIFTKGYILGGFDFEVGFLYPWKNMEWPNADIANAALHFKNHLVSDSVGVILPIKLYVVDAIKQGTLPFWNPYVLNGTSLIGNIQAAVLYPLNFLYFITSYPIAYNLYTLAQIVLAYIFMCLFLQKIGFRKIISVFGAVSFSFSAYIIVWLTLATIGHAYIWIPFVLWCFEEFQENKKNRFFIGIILGLTLSSFAGHIQTTLFVYLTYSLWVLCDVMFSKKYKTLQIFFLSLIFSFGLSAIALLPAYEAYMQSVRGSVTPVSFYRSEALAFTSYIQAIFPDFFGHPVTRNWWGKINYAESAIYFGTIPFLLFLYGLVNFQKKNRIYVSAFVITLTAFILSTENPISYVLYLLKIPIISSSTFARFSSIYIFGALILSCFGLTTLLQDLQAKNYKKNLHFFGATITILGIYWLLIITHMVPTLFKENISIILRNSILPSGFIVALTMTIFAGHVIYKQHKERKLQPQLLMGIAILLLTSIELLRFGNKYTPFSPQEFFYPEHPVIKELHKITSNDGLRYFDYLPTNANVRFQIPAAGGNDPLYNQYVGELAMQGNILGSVPTDRGSMQFPDGPNKQKILNLFSVAYYPDRENNFRNSWVDKNSGKQELFDENFELVWEENLYQIYKYRNALPRAYLVYDVIREDEKDKIFKGVTSDEFIASRSAYISFAGEGQQASGSGKVTNKKISPQEMDFSVTSDGKALLVLTDTYYPGWKALINGKEVEILRTNWGFRGVYVPKGASEIRFTYNPNSIRYGALLSIISIALLALYSLLKTRKTLTKPF